MEDYKAWVPSEYLTQYYATGTMTEDERGILRFIVDFLKATKLEVNEMLEVGCGPTIHHAIPFVPHAARLYMADYLESNLMEIRKLVDQSGQPHDWRPYITGVLDFEGIGTDAAIEERIQGFREKLVDLLSCNVLNVAPLGWAKKTFPLVTSFYCLECVTHSKEQWTDAMANVLSLVAPGGWTILSALRNADKYLICGKEFPATSIDENDMRQSLIANGFTAETINVQVCKSTWGEQGFDTIIVCSAQKGK